ncbi:porphobilinogen deaminase [Auricularia subglabra TFB-10046 SS5]|uniref:hydroxymethylbilane synthase n=1 Tax=Auricularia subglabra (strain TFB-10046 / SS5) TaxID=717982 RepID=J0D757_AURST|nr:porphobilinogen deaminase [Auricularia subglabra TFB-10046 SS5]
MASSDPQRVLDSAPAPSSARPIVRIGSRPSVLAKIQARMVQERLSALFPTHDFELSARVISVAGDRDKVRTLRSLNRDAQANATSLWTTELEDALIAGELDVLVHSLKDCPTTVRDGCDIIPVLPRENNTDCLVFKKGSSYTTLADLPDGSLIGTGSVRRIAQLKKRYPGLRFQDLRGNIDTRLAKLDDPEGPYAAAVLASAGLIRLNHQGRINAYLQPPDLYPAVGQGCLGAEFLTANHVVGDMVRALEDPASGWACRAERALLRVLEGGCAVPVGVWSTTTAGVDGKGLVLSLQSVLTSPDGQREVSVEESAVISTPEDAEALGQRAAVRIAAGGGREIMDDLRAEIDRAAAGDN